MENTKESRRKIKITLLITTLLFFAALGGALLLRQQIPLIREKRLNEALEQGDLARARELAAELGDEEKAHAFLVECDYREALTLMDEGRWEEADALLSAAAGYRDAAGKKNECAYQIAAQYADAGQWEEAEARFLALGGYGDALERYDECRFRRAQELEAKGAVSEAAALYSLLGDYPGARERLFAMAAAVTGIEDPEAAVAALQGQTPEELAHIAVLGEQREALPRGVVAVGFYHTVGLCADGTVLACGDNSFGQCEVAGFRDIKAVDAGAYHSLLLHADGTVSAVGRGSEGQCEVAEWKNVVQIAAGDYASFGLCADGTLLCTGYNDYSVPESWRGLRAVTAGSYNVAALRQDGSAWVDPALNGGEALQGMVDLAVNTGFGVGVLADGSVVGTAFTLDGWEDVLAVSASGTVVLGLRDDGHVLCHAFRQRDLLPLDGVSDAVAIAAGGTHSAVVLRDGSVLVFGDTSLGQGDTASWKLF